MQAPRLRRYSGTIGSCASRRPLRIRAELVPAGAIEPEDLDLVQLTDDPEEACRLLTESTSRREVAAKETEARAAAAERGGAGQSA